MKTVCKAYELESGNCRVNFPEALMSSLNLYEGSVIYGMFLTNNEYHEKSGKCPMINGETIPPLATFIASPFPTHSWMRLVRASFSVGTGIGRISHLLEALEFLNLFPRSIEATEGFDLDTLNFGNSSINGGSNQIRPSVMVVLELPRSKTPLSEIRVENGKTEAAVLEKKRDILHTLLNQVCNQTTEEQQKPEGENQNILLDRFNECFSLAINKIPKNGENAPETILVDWVSPMKILNRIGKRIEPDYSGTNRNDTKTQNSTSDNVSILPSAYRAKLELKPHDSETNLQLDFSDWRPFLWPSIRQSSFYTSNPKEKGLGVVLDTDSDEKVLTARFYPLDKYVLSQFEIEVPAANLDHRWIKWVYDIVNLCGGNVISTNSSGRLIGRWTNLSVTVVFPLCRGAGCKNQDGTPNIACNGSIGKIIECFRKLKETPIEYFYDEKQFFHPFLQTALAKELNIITEGLFCDIKDQACGYRSRVFKNCLPSPKAQEALAQAPKLESVLQRVMFMYARPESFATPEYEARYGRNPFDFTNPLDLKQFTQLYPIAA